MIREKRSIFSESYNTEMVLEEGREVLVTNEIENMLFSKWCIAHDLEFKNYFKLFADKTAYFVKDNKVCAKNKPTYVSYLSIWDLYHYTGKDAFERITVLSGQQLLKLGYIRSSDLTCDNEILTGYWGVCRLDKNHIFLVCSEEAALRRGGSILCTSKIGSCKWISVV